MRPTAADMRPNWAGSSSHSKVPVVLSFPTPTASPIAAYLRAVLAVPSGQEAAATRKDHQNEGADMGAERSSRRGVPDPNASLVLI